MKGELTPKWKAFADEWIKNGGNATQAYISAGYSENGANRSAQKLLSKTVITFTFFYGIIKVHFVHGGISACTQASIYCPKPKAHFT